MTKNACVLCSGCPESRIDSARIQNFLEENGWKISTDLEDADLILFRACGLREKSVEESLQTIRTIKARKKRNAQFIVWGCLPKIDPKSLRTEYSGFTFGEKEVTVLNKICDAKKPIEDVVANYVLPITQLKPLGFRVLLRKIQHFLQTHWSIIQNESIFQIKVSTGCLGNCSFCAVRKSRGVVQSKSIDQIVSEFKNGLKRGYRYFGLLATDLGSYGRDLGCTLVDLLEELTKEKGDYKIGLRNMNPQYLIEMFEQLKPFFSSGRIWFLSSAAESGSNRILGLMNRKYNIQDFKKCIQVLNNEYPDILLRTQLMVGFPTETEEDFLETLRLLDQLKFDWIEVFDFSPRKGTPAAELKGQIPEKIKKARFRQLTIMVLIKHPFKTLKRAALSFLRSYCEKQDWKP